MATRKNAKGKAQKSNELDAVEFFAAIRMIEEEKGIPKAYMIEKITQALVSAYKRDHEGVGDNVTVDANEELGTVRMFVKKDVVEEVDNPCTEMSLEEAQAALPRAQLGDVLRIEVKPRNFGRIAAQTARQVIIQGMREAERGMIYDEFNSKEHEILTGLVTRIDPRSGAASLRIGSGNESTEGYLAVSEQVKGEPISEGMRLRVMWWRSAAPPRVPRSCCPGPIRAWSSACSRWRSPRSMTVRWRSNPSPARPGPGTKLAVWSADPNVDAIGACVGPRGQRVNNIVEELGGEKVDIIKYSEDPAEYIAAALSPADVISVTTLEEGKSCRVVVPDDQLSLAIGKEGQNARLAAKLTGYKIDIKPESAPVEELEPAAEEEEDFLADGEVLAPEVEEASEEADTSGLEDAE